MARPGVTIHAHAPADAVVASVIESFVAMGFSQRSAPGAEPVELRHGSQTTTTLAEVVTEVVPVAFLAPVWKQRKVMRARIRTLESSGAASVVRVDARFDELRTLTVPLFTDAVQSALSSLTARGIDFRADDYTDSGRKGW